MSARYEAAAAAWRDHRRADEPVRAKEIDKALVRVEWQRDVLRAARKFLANTVKGNGAAIVAELDAYDLDKFGRVGFDIERGTGRLVVRAA
jgi:hypothetical protein